MIEFFIIVISLIIIMAIPYYLNKRGVLNVLKKFRQKNAISPESAKTMEDLGLPKPSSGRNIFQLRNYRATALHGLMRLGIVETTEDGRMYLIEDKIKKNR